MQNAYFDNYPVCCLVVELAKNTKLSFAGLILGRGYSPKVVDELWKWYDFSEKKGVASF